MRKKIHDSMLQYGEQIAQSYQAIHQQFDLDIIHQFRIAVKKFRALLRWLHTGERTLGSLKKIYHVAGELHDNQTVLRRLGIEKIRLPGFEHWLMASALLFKKEWGELYRQKKMQQLQRKLANINRQQYKGDDKFLNKNIHKIQRILRCRSINGEALHEIRKKIKELEYVLSLDKRMVKQIAEKGSRLFLRRLKSTAKQIGDYNDTRIALSLLSSYLKQEKEAWAIQPVLSILQLWEAQKIKQKKAIVDSIKYYEKLSL